MTACRRARITCRCTRRATRRAAPKSLVAAGAAVDAAGRSRAALRGSAVGEGDARSQFDAFQPTSVLAGQELTKQLEMSLGATLESQPGVAARSFGPAPARPVVRGLDGDRVLILQDGQRIGDLSSQSGDHGVTVNPAAAQRIEVVRGPATLLYGANAIGGLVNVITDDIPTRPQMGASGNVTFDLGSRSQKAARPPTSTWATARWRLHVGGGGRRSGDVDTPEATGELAVAQRLRQRGPVLDRAKSYFGGSYGYDDRGTASRSSKRVRCS